MLKKIALFFTGLITLTALGQDIDQLIVWNFSTSYEGDEATITVTVNQKDGWHIYSQIQPDGAIPLPTVFTFVESDAYSLIGKTKEYGSELHDNDGFPERAFLGSEAKFVQKIKVKSKTDFQLKIQYEFMACKEACLPPADRDTEITIKGTSNLDLSTTTVQADPTENISTEDSLGGDLIQEEKTISPVGFQAYATYSNSTNYELIITPIINGDIFLVGSNAENPLSISFDGQFEAQEAMQTASFIDSIHPKLKKQFLTFNEGQFSQKITINPNDSAQVIKAKLNFVGIDTAGIKFKSLNTEISIPLEEAFYAENSDGISENSYWGIFLLAFGGGLLALRDYMLS